MVVYRRNKGLRQGPMEAQKAYLGRTAPQLIPLTMVAKERERRRWAEVTERPRQDCVKAVTSGRGTDEPSILSKFRVCLRKRTEAALDLKKCDR